MLIQLIILSYKLLEFSLSGISFHIFDLPEHLYTVLVHLFQFIISLNILLAICFGLIFQPLNYFNQFSSR